MNIQFVHEGKPFDPATLTEEESERILDAVLSDERLSPTAARIYASMFRQARESRPTGHCRHMSRTLRITA